jgi:PAS domain S-box-containing protein
VPPGGADLILRHIGDALVFLDIEGRVIYANERFCEMVNRPAADVLGLRWSDFGDAEVCAKLDPQVSPALLGDQVHFNIDLPASSGVHGTYCLTACLVHDEAGRPIGVLQNFRSMDRLRDIILDLKDVNLALKREKDRTEHIMDSLGDGIFTVDRELLIRSFSPRMEALTGLRSAEVIGRRCADVLRGSKCESDCPLAWSLENAAVVDRCHERLRLSDGRDLPVSVTTAFLHDAHGDRLGLTGVVRDESEIERLRREVHDRRDHHDIVGRAPAMRELLAAIEALAGTDATVLISGETGTGKELVAQAIHHESARRNRGFVSLNCAAVNDNLLESELFGHVRGAFTGAVVDRAGRFEVAAGGTIFLDEIGDTTPAFQAKLLRVLQEKTFERVGDTKTRQTDVRVITATNRDLRRLVSEGRFREDLYYRLAVIPIRVPALRERREDIPLLVEFFIQKYGARYAAGREQPFDGISNRALALLMEYDWPGNVRELEHAIEYAMISTTSNRIERAFLPAPVRQFRAEAVAALLPRPLAENDADRLRYALEANRWNESQTARVLGISRTTLWRRMRRFGLMGSP